MEDGSLYCKAHGSANVATKNTQKKTTTPASSKKTTTQSKKDPYNAANYNDYEDFYEDWYDEFEDIDEAEMYWDEYN